VCAGKTTPVFSPLLKRVKFDRATSLDRLAENPRSGTNRPAPPQNSIDKSSANCRNDLTPGERANNKPPQSVAPA
jgi:hypothetical protein